MSDLLERLRRVENGDGTGDHVTHWHRNPDGPEAAAEIERLRAEIASLRLTAEERDAIKGCTAYDEAARDTLRTLLERLG